MPIIAVDNTLAEIVERLSTKRCWTAPELLRLLGVRYNLQGWTSSSIERKRALGQIEGIRSGNRWSYTTDSIIHYLRTQQED